MVWELSLENLYHFWKDQRPTSLHGLPTFSVTETYTKFMLSSLTNHQNRTDVTNTFHEVSDTRNQNGVQSSPKRCPHLAGFITLYESGTVAK